MLAPRRPNLAKKMFLFFLLLILIPCLLVSFVFFLANQTYFQEQQHSFAQEKLIQYRDDAEKILENHEQIYTQLLEHPNFLRFLDGFYFQDSDQIALYRSEFLDMFTYAENTLPKSEATSIHVYMLNGYLLPMGQYLSSIADLDNYTISSKPDHGYWYFNSEKEIYTWQKAIFSTSTRDRTAILEVSCAPSVLYDSLTILSDTTKRPAYLLYNKQPFALEDGNMIPLDTIPECEIQVSFSKIPLKIFLGELPSTPYIHFNILSITMLVSLLLILICSILYYIRVSRLSKRIVNFSNHISGAMKDSPTPFTDTEEDEFSALVQNFNQMVVENDQLISQVKLEQLIQNELSYKILQAQIDPHFLYNSLEGIRMMAEIHDDEEVSEMLFALSRLMRYTFSVKKTQTTLEQEITLVEQYLKIQKMRLGSKMQYTISSDPDVHEITCPRFIIQPLVENAIKYALGNAVLHVRIHVGLEQDHLIVLVENDGNNLTLERINKINQLLSENAPLSDFASGTGIGLDNINSRMRHLFPNSFSLTLNSLRGGSSLCVKLSWNPSDQ